MNTGIYFTINSMHSVQNFMIMIYVRQNINLKLKSISTSLTFKKKSGSPVVFNCSLTTNHDFKCNALQISNNKSSYNKRLISEMMHIRKQKHEFSKITRNYYLNRPSLSLLLSST